MSTTTQPGIERLPRGPHRLSREQVADHQRGRIIAAMIAEAGTRGYGATTIGDITRRARVSRDTFYEQFANKEQCLLAAYDATTRELLDQMVAAGTSQASYVEGIRDGVRAYLRFWSERADAARVWSLDVLTAGEEALVHRERTIESFTRLFRAIAERAATEQPGLPNVPDVVARATVVAAVELTTQYIREDRVSSLLELESDVLYLWLMVFAGHDVAAAAVAESTGKQHAYRAAPQDAHFS
jgi:AcrR family transcriptional regulator